VTIVFSRLERTPGDDPRADADLVEALSDEPCSVFIYPASLGDTTAGFQQVIAHELFHCFQAFNFDVRGSYLAHPASAWWVEGSATYFSNVAYPAVNLEWEHTSEFDSTSPTVALTQMSYEATFFFQHLGNTIGNKAAIGLLDTLPVGGDEASHQAALRAYPGMDTLFQDFAQHYLDTTIMDTGGAPIPFAPDTSETTIFDRSGTFDSKIPPFVIRRRTVVFDPALTFTLEVAPKDGPSHHAFAASAGTWGAAPPTIDCDDPRTWTAVFTSVGVDGGASTPALVTATVGATEDACENPAPATDACLQGTWAVTDYEAFLRAALDLAGASTSAMPISFEGASGDLALTFDATTITYAATGFELRGSATTPEGIAVSVAVRLNGVATSGYEVTEPGTIELIEPDATGLSVEAEVFIAGASAGVTPMDPLDWIFFLSPTYGFTCNPTTLNLTIPPLAEPVVLARGG